MPCGFSSFSFFKFFFLVNIYSVVSVQIAMKSDFLQEGKNIIISAISGPSLALMGNSTEIRGIMPRLDFNLNFLIKRGIGLGKF